jgi:lipopolysaccharide/colanic/teichoic acid biosynthesis glycosyltransferase
MNTHMESFRVSAQIFDLDSSDDLIRILLSSIKQSISISDGGHSRISPTARIIGPVLLGNHVRIDDKALIVGPAILDHEVSIGREALVHQSIVTQGQSIAPFHVVRNSIIDSVHQPSTISNTTQSRILFSPKALRFDCQPYRLWPCYSYNRTIKRALDIMASLIILILFLPFFPIIALAIKLNSPGPVFYRARRQGLHGREFGCLKFRSMITTADSLQEKLRIINQVDGPQFKMENDPRVSTIGRFLRATNLDEIPQFINVLIGQMSIVGPRPSPDAENTLCPYWRYARLSVRPGITGLWQMLRTRIPARDFQEWVYYDTMYVRKISLKFDLWIAWKTAQKLILNFFDQF